MRRKLATFVPPRLWIAVGMCLVAGACGRSIGDECTTNVDCSLTPDRSCDIAQPGGYCTVEGCDLASCPDDSLCVRHFPFEFLTRACDPRTGSIPSGDACRPDELCLTGGLCAPRSTERRFCAARCGGGGDCRSGYECRVVGEFGSEPLDPRRAGRDKFCAPRAVRE
jgi:hypothetical protein